MNEDKKINNKKQKSKRTVIVIFALCIVIAISYFIIESINKPDRMDNAPGTMYSDKNYSYVFYPTNFDLDVTEDEWYMGLNREIYYKFGSVSYAISEKDAESSAVLAFFVKYFDTAIAGDTETYNTFFTENYYKTNKPYVQFAPQMIYNIEVEERSITQNSDGTTTYGFYVTYMIYKNDGTFRNDIESDASKTLYYELIEYADGDVMIYKITKK